MRTLALGLLCVVLPIGAGCHRRYVIHDPLTAEEVVALSREGRSPDEIIRHIDRSGTVYLLDARDILELAEKGVDPEVIEHMRVTRERDLERRRAYYYDYPPGPLYYHYWRPYGFGYHFGWRSYWWW